VSVSGASYRSIVLNYYYSLRTVLAPNVFVGKYCGRILKLYGLGKGRESFHINWIFDGSRKLGRISWERMGKDAGV